MTVGSVKAIRVQDIVTWNIISTNKWQRPIYFADTCSSDSKIGLNRYFRMDGSGNEACPGSSAERYRELLSTRFLRRTSIDSPAGYSKTFQRGYKYRGLNDSTCLFDENATRLMTNYRNAFLRLALENLTRSHNYTKAAEALDSMESKIPHKVIPMDYRLLYEVANFYSHAGEKEKSNQFSDEVVAKLIDLIHKNPDQPMSEYNPYTLLLSIYQSRAEYEKAIDILNTIAARYGEMSPGMKEQVKERIARIQIQMKMKNDTIALQPQQKK